MMKVRWKDHEIIFVTVLAAAGIFMILLNGYGISYGGEVNDFATVFGQNNIPFNYITNAVLPQVGAIGLVYVVYLLVNLIVLPWIKKISFDDFEKILAWNVLKVVAAILITAYILAIGVNLLSYYGKPHLFNYGHYQILASLGYNDQPLTDLFFGFGRAIWFVLLLVILGGVREFITWRIERPNPGREFRVLVVNNLTPLLFVYFIIPFLINPVHDKFMDYLAWATPILVLYIYQTFWLFPFREERKWQERRVLTRLLLSTMAGAFFSALVFQGGNRIGEFFGYWLFLLVVITPLCWLLYQQRKDKILQLKGIEMTLARTTTDLQFLRSQINPHFLFNVLNTLYGTALREKSEKTAEGIQMLGDMMRFILHENNQDFISMDKEIDYLENYIALQKLRIAPLPGIEIKDNIGEAKCNRQIAPMLLIPFIENAFKHGVSLKERCWIDIKLECTGSLVSLEVRNSTHDHVEGDPEKNKSGIGLANVKERLRLLYPGKHELTTGRNGNEFIAKLIIH